MTTPPHLDVDVHLPHEPLYGSIGLDQRTRVILHQLAQ